MTIGVNAGALVTMGVVGIGSSPVLLFGAATLLTLAALSFVISDKHLPQNKAKRQLNAIPSASTAVTPRTSTSSSVPVTPHSSTSNTPPLTPSNSSSTSSSLVALFNPGRTPSPSPNSEYVLVRQSPVAS